MACDQTQNLSITKWTLYQLSHCASTIDWNKENVYHIGEVKDNENTDSHYNLMWFMINNRHNYVTKNEQELIKT